MSNFSETPHNSWFNLGVKGKKVSFNFHSRAVSGSTMKEEGEIARSNLCGYMNMGVFPPAFVLNLSLRA